MYKYARMVYGKKIFSHLVITRALISLDTERRNRFFSELVCLSRLPKAELKYLFAGASKIRYLIADSVLITFAQDKAGELIITTAVSDKKQIASILTSKKIQLLK